MFVALRRIVVVAILVAGSAFVLAPSASAITAESTLPADGSTVPPPETIRVIHDEGLNPLTSSIAVRDKDSVSVAGSTSYATTLVANDTIVFTPSAPLTDGLSDYSVTAIGRAIIGSGTTTTNFSFTVDSIAPDAPVVTLVTNPVNAANQAGVAVKGDPGSAEPGATISAYIQDGGGTGILGQEPAGGDGSYLILLDLTTLQQGALSVQVSATDAAFNVSPVTHAGPITKDSLAPAAPTTVDFEFDPITSGNESAVTVSGDVAENGATMNVSVDDESDATDPVTGSTTSASSAYSVPLDLSSLNQGTLTATVTATDAADNTSAEATATAVKETGAPAFVSSSPVADATIAPPDAISVTYDEALDPSSTITVVDGGTNTVTGVVTFEDDDSTIVFTPDAPLSGADNPFTVTSTATDGTNTESPATSFSFSIDAIAPDAPTITSTDSEVRPSNATTFTVAGEAETGSTVEVTVADGSSPPVVGTTTASSPWELELDVSSLNDGTLTITATATDAANNESDASAPTQVTKYAYEIPFSTSARPVNGTYTPIRGDFDGDGNSDIFWYAPGSNPDYLWFSQGDGTYTQISRPVNGRYLPIASDHDDDGDTDIFWYAAGSNPDYLWESRGDGTFGAFHAPVNGTYTPISGDYNGDGFGDIFFYRAGTAAELLLHSNADGSFEYITLNVNGTYTPITGDFDGDDDTDIFWYAAGPSPDYLWESRGDGKFGNYYVPVNGIYTPISGDYDDDGTTDILWYAPGSRPDWLWLSQGNMTFGAYSRPADGSHTPVVGDYDGDGDTDIVWYAPGTDADHLWSSLGDGTFTVIPLTQDGVFTPLSGDHDADGDTDILWYAPGPAADELWLATLSEPGGGGGLPTTG